MITDTSTKPGFLMGQFHLITDYWSKHTPGEGYAEFAEEASGLVKESVADQNRYVQSSAGSALGVALLAGSLGAGLFEWGNQVITAKAKGEIPLVALVRFPIEGIIGGAMSVYETGKKWVNEGISDNCFDASYEVTGTLGTAVLLAGGARALAKGGVGASRNLAGFLNRSPLTESAPRTAYRGGIVLDAVEEVGSDGEITLRVPGRNPRSLLVDEQSVTEGEATSLVEYQAQSFPSGLQVELAEAADIAKTAFQVLDDSQGTTIPNNRIVLNTQGWASLPVLTSTLLNQLQALAEKSGITLCLKTALAGHLATEFQPSAVTAGQQAAGPMAAAGAETDRVLVPAESYEVGVDAPESFKNSRRQVTLTRSFEIGRYPITHGERTAVYGEMGDRVYALMAEAPTGRRFVASVYGDNGRIQLAIGTERELTQAHVVGDIPVQLVRVVPDPDKLLKAIPKNQREARQPAVGWLYDELVAFANVQGARLPTAVEWEVAARTAEGNPRLFDYSTKNGLLWDGAQRMADFGGKAPQDVGSYPPNRRGIYDMTGGVWEYVDTFDGLADVVETVNPTGPRVGDFRSVRGGSSFSKNEVNLRAAFGEYYHPGYRNNVIGGRLVWRPQHSLMRSQRLSSQGPGFYGSRECAWRESRSIFPVRLRRTEERCAPLLTRIRLRRRA